ncbi:MAG TPA: hypothetical protein VK077_10600 [Virgibacillus sp.]|nr:hypothetical protein [Virgibacillus sp.]
MTYHMKNNEECFIETHYPEASNTQVCDGTTVTYFEDFTKNHNKAAIEVEIENVTGPCMVTAIIETRCGQTIERPINLVNGYGERSFQVEDVCRVALRGESYGSPYQGGYPPATNDAAESTSGWCPSPTTFEAEVELEKTFCICCPNKEKHHHGGSKQKPVCGCTACQYKANLN